MAYVCELFSQKDCGQIILAEGLRTQVSEFILQKACEKVKGPRFAWTPAPPPSLLTLVKGPLGPYIMALYNGKIGDFCKNF